MNKVLKYVAAALAATTLCFGAGVLSSRERSGRSTLTCTGLDVTFLDSLQFVTADDIDRCLKNKYGAYIGQNLDSMGLDRMEKILNGESAILETQAWTTGDGVLHISVRERTPALKFTKGDISYYADADGCIFPLSGKTADVPEVSGYIPLSAGARYKGPAATEKERIWLKSILDMSAAFESAKGWKGNVVSYELTRGGDVVVRRGDRPEAFIIGEPTGTKAKIARLEKYFTHILPSSGEKEYRTVNVKYNGQIICRKGI